ncbi:MAG: hypothetical protein A3K19_31255 [Lentisphaerae bacterium RIFOXYB12_FULL_65_16]|nr:MAG: hypothetical protein A3K18_22615 [Lentisphaerae bacterium RIFOXYA12_64_32]OGV87163.1 MAG: hypothetical protein A3K19_31255 [Lentisphaerae bacterium RIFOXYB12_FULL_65_16]
MLFCIRKAFRLVAGGSVLLPFSILAAADTAPLPGAEAITWQAVVTAVERHNPELAALGVQPDIEAGNLRQAAARPNPELEGELSEFAGTEERRDLNVAETTVTLSQTLELGGRRAARVTAAQRVLDEANAAVTARRQELLGEARQRYVDLLLKQELVALDREAAGIATQALATEERRLELKAATTVDVSRAKTAAATIRANLARAEIEVAAARVRLAAMWGDDKPRFAAAAGTLQQSPTLPALDTLLARVPQTPALVCARLAVDRTEAERAVEQTKRRPDVSVYGGFTHFSETHDGALVAGVSMPLPLFDRNQGAIAAAAARRRQAEAEVLTVDAVARSAVAAAYHEHAAAWAAAELLARDALPAAKAAYDAVSEGYEKGKYGWLDVTEAREAWLDARRQHLEHLGAAHQALAEIEGIVGPLPPAANQEP